MIENTEVIQTTETKDLVGTIHDNTPLVSIIVRTVNRPELLQEAIQSIADQEYSPIELIIVNDGSDDFGDIVTAKAKGAIKSLQYIKNDGHHGRSEAANIGLAYAKGEYLGFLDDDDFISPEHIVKLVQKLKDHPEAILSHTDTVNIDENGSVIGAFLGAPDQRTILGVNFMPIHSVLFRRSAYEKGSRFDAKLTLFEDWDFWIQLSRLGDFIHTPGESAFYRQIATGVSRSGVQDIQTAHQAKLKILLKWRPLWSHEDLLFINDQFRDGCQLPEITSQNSSLRSEIEILRASISEAEDREAQHMVLIEQFKTLVAQIKVEASQLNVDLELSNQRLNHQSSVIKQRDDLIALLNLKISHLNEDFQEIVASRSWRLTAPLRTLVNFARHLKNKLLTREI